MVTKRAEIQRQLDHLIASYPTEHDEHEPYWRGVRHGLETALSILDDPEYLWFQNSRASGHDQS